MAKRTAPQQPQPANLLPQQMKAAIPKLQRRIDELKAIDVSVIQDRGDTRVAALKQKIDDTLVEIFGNDTVDYQRFRVGSLWEGPMIIGHRTTPSEARDGFRRGIDRAISSLNTIIELFSEKLQDLGETTGGRAIRAISEIDLHPEIERSVSKLFSDGHYANAVEDACKVLDNLVKNRSGRDDLSGTDLMQMVFSPKAPILRFNKLQTETDRSEQQGMMFLYAGAMLALRNPRAHTLIQDDPEQALESLAFLNLLAKSLDRAEKV